MRLLLCAFLTSDRTGPWHHCPSRGSGLGWNRSESWSGGQSLPCHGGLDTGPFYDGLDKSFALARRNVTSLVIIELVVIACVLKQFRESRNQTRRVQSRAPDGH